MREEQIAQMSQMLGEHTEELTEKMMVLQAKKEIETKLEAKIAKEKDIKEKRDFDRARLWELREQDESLDAQIEQLVIKQA